MFANYTRMRVSALQGRGFVLVMLRVSKNSQLVSAVVKLLAPRLVGSPTNNIRKPVVDSTMHKGEWMTARPLRRYLGNYLSSCIFRAKKCKTRGKLYTGSYVPPGACSTST